MTHDIYKLVNKHKLSDTEHKILSYLLNNIETALSLSVREVAQKNYSSPATVIKLAKKMNFTGYNDMIYRLYFSYHRDIKEDKTNLSLILLEDLFKKVTQATVDKIINLLQLNRDKVIYVCGSGFSKPIAEYFSMKLQVLGFKSIFSDLFSTYENNPFDAGLVIMISKSGETGNIIKIAEKAKESQLSSILFSSSNTGKLSELSDMTVVIEDINQLDDQNIQQNYFYSGSLFLIESLLKEYLLSKGK
ncbi:MurR/RpiR family transcriptional regulator [Vagococcus intermedius]|uniref:MurR/RpiR family transcriptional regulator n=1 Tax=Vagococcus intermedius TaxID=2991418 RepID=A0AAF0CUD1_9ENTE|nr:MurR/RpiR family transcriptional regulator [Vagococcus intermedius]WEG73056.1 MurR/RpiR family transcriptional regulator [Vagococcus intermedius]WEG75140.1 MurR/RpiR family transcriptional regulator [Vagococcus intermedius]